jgi:pyruvate/2-oxoglutarate dehydrogenase complex dihydrolipoamide acyltransferase (E2) component
VLKNLVLVRKRRMSAFRKIALGTWSTVGDPSVYGTIELRMDRALEYLALFNAKTGRRATVTHLVAKAAAAALITFDHRFIDGVHAAEMAKVFRAWIHHPSEHYDSLEPGNASGNAG